VLSLVVALMPLTAQAGDTIDLDLWHEELIEALGEEPEETGDRRPALGIYPTLGGSIGFPTWVSAQGHAYLSFTDGKSFSIYAGYGVEWGPKTDASIITVGWGGVRPIPVASKQTGFHGKFLRYRRPFLRHRERGEFRRHRVRDRRRPVRTQPLARRRANLSQVRRTDPHPAHKATHPAARPQFLVLNSQFSIFILPREDARHLPRGCQARHIDDEDIDNVGARHLRRTWCRGWAGGSSI
jgi:hypothetical protein